MGARAIAGLIGGVVALATLWWAVSTVFGWKHDAALLPVVKAEYASYVTAAEKIAEDAKAARVRDTDTIIKAVEALGVVRGEAAALREAVARKPLVVTREVPRDAESQTCPESRLSPAFRLCVNAAASGGPAAIAACQAAGVPDPD